MKNNKLIVKRILRSVLSILQKLRKPVNFLICVNSVLLFALVVRLQTASQYATPAVVGAIDAGVLLYQQQLTVAMEAFDFLHNQRLGKNPLPTVDWTAKTVKRSGCWLRTPHRFVNHTPSCSRPRWQTLRTAGMELHLFDAYLDTRFDPTFPAADGAVRLLAMSRRTVPRHLHCQLRTQEDELVVVQARTREIWQRAWDPRTRFYIPLLIECPIPTGLKQLQTASVVNEPCARPETEFRIADRNTAVVSAERNRVVVCVKGMDFLKDVSVRLVEWLEWQRLLGADRVLMYTYYVHPKTERVLDYYVKSGFLLRVHLTLPGDSPNSPYQRSRFIWRNRQQKRRNEIIPYNDCLYRHVNTHDYALIVDTDEIVVPIRHRNWTEMLDAVRAALPQDHGRWTAFSVRNAFKFDRLTTEFNQSIPSFMHTLRHKRRSVAISKPGEYGKSFMFVPNLLTVFNHYSLDRLQPQLKGTLYIASSVALKLHYKEQCPIESRDECPQLIDHTMEDTSVDQFAAQITKRVELVLRRLHLYGRSMQI